MDYAGLQRRVKGTMSRVKQGVVKLIPVDNSPEPTKPWNKGGTDGAPVTLDAAVRAVDQKYIDGTLIIATDSQVTFSVPSVEPKMSDKLEIDGKTYAMKRLLRIPSAGTPVAYIAFVAL